MVTARWTKLRPHLVQHALWTCSKRFVLVPAGRGSGKTELAKRRLIRYLVVKKDWPDPRYFYGGPTRDQAKRIAWTDLQALIPPAWVASVNRSDLMVKTIFGSELWLFGMDIPQRMEGQQWDGCVLDESCDLKPGVFDRNVLPALTHRNGWCWRIGVPKRQGPAASEYREAFELAQTNDDPDSAGFTWPSSDILEPRALEYARRHMDAKDFQEQFDARFVTAGGAVFYAFEREFNRRPCEYHADKPLIIGSDFNVDPMAWVIGHRYENHIEWIDEIWLHDTNTPKTLEVLYARYCNHHSGFEFYGDATASARKTSASCSDYAHILAHTGFQKLGRTIHYPRANPLEADRFAACNALLCNAAGDRRMFVDPRCVNLVKDLESRYYKPGTKVAVKVGDLSHATDAIGYAVYPMFPVVASTGGTTDMTLEVY